MSATKRSAALRVSISELAALYEYGELQASTDPAAFLREVAAEVKSLRKQRITALQEAVIQAAVAQFRDESAHDGYLPSSVYATSSAVDALLAAESAWREGK